ncbi:peptidase inhibitor family I36 protein [Streptomyces sp. NBC_00424]|uniref:peptidase inhibitor family I36 protein n=2 Tax=unclassified Streptomyces TaxID=2593676 RepID=UPI002255E522|nr:peptidase inhibitor family I36 protein [Streptomyces sp. NBC_00424]MCX5071291.1 peptidase inhibitor family I36 protein [Streptomyces sp. NBC_00424]
MRMTRKLAGLAGGIALTGGLLAGSAGTAGAAASDCPSGYFCVWSGQNYIGQRQQIAGSNSNLTQYAVFQNFKSWYNHGASCALKWYSGTNYTGSSGIIPKGNKQSDSVGHYMKSNNWVNCS